MADELPEELETDYFDRHSPSFDLDQRHYTTHGPIASGGFGVVVRAESTGQDGAPKQHAVKLARTEYDQTLLREASLFDPDRSYRHVVAPTASGHVEVGGSQRPAVVMDLMDESLTEAMWHRGRTPYSAEETALIMSQITRGIREVDGIVHRDLKPENILLKDGRAMVGDWGLAVPTGYFEEGRAAGTPHYMAPEQIRGLPASEANDVHAIASIGYELNTLQPARQLNAVDQKARASEIAYDDRQLSVADPYLSRIIAKAREHDLEARSSSIELLTDLAGYESVAQDLSPAERDQVAAHLAQRDMALSPYPKDTRDRDAIYVQSSINQRVAFHLVEDAVWSDSDYGPPPVVLTLAAQHKPDDTMPMQVLAENLRPVDPSTVAVLDFGVGPPPAIDLESWEVGSTKSLLATPDPKQQTKTETALYGRVLAGDDLGKLDQQALQGQHASWEHLVVDMDDPRSTASLGVDPQQAMEDIRERVPEFSRSRSRTIAKAMAEDYRHAVDAIQADDRYVAMPLAGGAKHVGILDQQGYRSGDWYQVDSDNRIREYAQFKDGLVHGRYATYYPNGVKELSGSFDQGLPAGRFTRYDEQGNVVGRNQVTADGEVQRFRVSETVATEDGPRHQPASTPRRSFS